MDRIEKDPSTPLRQAQDRLLRGTSHKKISQNEAIKDFRITIVQSQLHWEARDKNLEMFGKLLSGLKGKTDLIVLPEMFTTDLP